VREDVKVGQEVRYVAANAEEVDVTQDTKLGSDLAKAATKRPISYEDEPGARVPVVDGTEGGEESLVVLVGFEARILPISLTSGARPRASRETRGSSV
jgi:hypothetical protein